jgi:hypothetical protein
LTYTILLAGELDDFHLVLERARKAGVDRMIITGGSLSESKEALEVAESDGTLSFVRILWQYRTI